MSVDVGKYPTLRDDQRIEARHKARVNLMAKLGGEPRLEDFERRRWSPFGTRIELLTLLGLIVVFLSALWVSSGHIYRVFGNNPAMVVLAESTILALTMVPTVWNTPRYVTAMMYAGVLGAAMIAAVGNIDAEIVYTSSPLNWITRWWSTLGTAPKQWTAATVPPVTTVLVGQALKYYALSRSKGRHEAKLKYDHAMDAWQQKTDTLEQHSDWLQTYAAALWDAWRYGKRREVVQAITLDEQRAIVRREMDAERWFVSADQPEIHRNSVKARSDETPPREIVLKYLKDNPADVEMNQAELASILGVSAPTVNRAIRDFRSNGHSNGHHEE